jgi:hypothetical protein
MEFAAKLAISDPAPFDRAADTGASIEAAGEQLQRA